MFYLTKKKKKMRIAIVKDRTYKTIEKLDLCFQ